MAKIKDPQAKKQLGKLKAYQDLFNDPNGEKVIQDLMTRFGMKTSTFNTDPYVTAFNEGQRNVVLYILTRMNLDINEIRKQLEARDV